MDTYLIIIGEIDWSKPGPLGIPAGIALFALWFLSQLKESNEKVARVLEEEREEREAREREHQSFSNKPAAQRQAREEREERVAREAREREHQSFSNKPAAQRQARDERLTVRKASAHCRFCNRSVSAAAFECPHCGARKFGWRNVDIPPQG